MAQIGAALGRSFSHQLISAVAPMPQSQVDNSLIQLVGAELIYRRGTPPDAEYTFKHALIQDSAYGTLLRGPRQQLHAHIATVLESQFPDVVAAEPAVLAQHCEVAGLTGEAVGYWLSAGRQALARFAMTEAIAQLRKGLALISHLPDGAARQAQELELTSALGHALTATKGFSAPESGELFDRARHLCEQLGRPQQFASVLHGQLVYRFVRAELARADDHASEMLRLGEQSNDAKMKHDGRYLTGVLRSVMGKFIDARAYCEEALSLWDPEFRTIAASPEDPYVGNRLYYYRALLCLGHVAQARLFRSEAVTEARRLSPFSLAYALYHYWLGDWIMDGKTQARVMLRSADEIRAISNEHGVRSVACVWQHPAWLVPGNAWPSRGGPRASRRRARRLQGRGVRRSDAVLVRACSHLSTWQIGRKPGVLGIQPGTYHASTHRRPMGQVRGRDRRGQAARGTSAQGRPAHDRSDYLAAEQRCQMAVDPCRTG